NPRREAHLPIREIQKRLSAIPGVTTVSYSSMELLTNGLWITSFKNPGSATPAAVDSHVLEIGPDFFSTMKMPLRAGRDFASADFAAASAAAVADPAAEPAGSSAPPPAIVNETFVRKYFGNADPLGRRISYAPSPGETAGQRDNPRGAGMGVGG